MSEASQSMAFGSSEMIIIAVIVVLLIIGGAVLAYLIKNCLQKRSTVESKEKLEEDSKKVADLLSPQMIESGKLRKSKLRLSEVAGEKPKSDTMSSESMAKMDQAAGLVKEAAAKKEPSKELTQVVVEPPQDPKLATGKQPEEVVKEQRVIVNEAPEAVHSYYSNTSAISEIQEQPPAKTEQVVKKPPKKPILDRKPVSVRKGQSPKVTFKDQAKIVSKKPMTSVKKTSVKAYPKKADIKPMPVKSVPSPIAIKTAQIRELLMGKSSTGKSAKKTKPSPVSERKDSTPIAKKAAQLKDILSKDKK